MTSQIFTQLNCEWDTVISDASVSMWADQCPVLVGCWTAGEVLAAVQTDPNQVLLFLVEQAQAGNELAGRIVVQTMLGKLVRMSICGRARSVRSAASDLVASLWERIMTLPLTGTLNNIPARLALDTLHASQQVWAREEALVLPAETSSMLVMEQSRVRGTDDELSAAAVLSAGEQWMCPQDAALMRLLYSDGVSVAEAASVLEVSPQTAYRRRQSGLGTLRAHARDLLAA